MSVTIRSAPSGEDVLVSTPGDGANDPTRPETYLNGVSPLSVTNWLPYIMAALVATSPASDGVAGTVEYGARGYDYPITSRFTVPDGASVLHVGNKWECQLVGEFDDLGVVAGFDADLAVGVTLDGVLLRRGNVPTNKHGIQIGHPNLDRYLAKTTLIDCAFHDFSSADTVQAVAGINIIGHWHTLKVYDAYAETAVAPLATGTLTGISVVSVTESLWTYIDRPIVEAPNMKQAMVIGNTYMRRLSLRNPDLANGDWTGLLFAYFAPPPNDFRSSIQNPKCYNFGGSGLYLSGNDGVPTFNTYAKGIILSNIDIQFCGGELDGPFACGLNFATAGGIINGGRVTGTGKRPDGSQRGFYANSVGVSFGSLCDSEFTVSDLIVENGFYAFSSMLVSVLTMSNCQTLNVERAGYLELSANPAIPFPKFSFSNCSFQANNGTTFALRIDGYAANQPVLNWSGGTLDGGLVGLQLSRMHHGYVRGVTCVRNDYGVHALADFIDRLGYTFFIDQNVKPDGVAAVLVGEVAGTIWPLVGPNQCGPGVNQAATNGAPGNRTHEYARIPGGDVKDIRLPSATLPTIANVPSLIAGDTFWLPAPYTANAYARLCTDAAAPTFGTLVHT